MSQKHPGVDAYLAQATRWREEMRTLRKIILEFPLREDLKWAKPFYSFQEGNVLVIWAFKAHCALGFCKGALLKDSRGILVKPGENTQAARKIPFTSVTEIIGMKTMLKAYIEEAIEVERAGLEVAYKKPSDLAIPAELQSKLLASRDFKTAFHQLTPGRQRGYVLFFSAPKQSKTRTTRIEKCAPRILAGRGLQDR